ncbi:DUF6193 family natural product biosynthesis protein [Kitasatospora fiedleri]|uniref:DUF6193 family natural product biosynthesis protein n=1 Tax=Kitasatospora fiedleri TaxID=2991545 RepID=UPI00249ACF74|nr:DUF6193 family natural product biosynthesis protein [Kitasatospora fiedleri]
MTAPRYASQDERDAAAAELGAQLARIAAAAGVLLPPARELSWCRAGFVGETTAPDGADGADGADGPDGAALPVPDRADVRWKRDASAPHLRLHRGRVTSAQGWAPDLTGAVRAAAAWLAGADLAAIRRAAPFLHVPDWAFVHERAPLDRIELCWRTRLEDFAHGPYPTRAEVRVLWEAAFAEPRLRRLRPVSSHFTLWFSSEPDYPFERVGAAVEPLHTGGYLVRGLATGPVTVATPAEAVALAVAALPPEPSS